MSEHASIGLRSLQRRLENFYGLEQAPDIGDFIRQAPRGARETVLIRERDGDVELAVMMPDEAWQAMAHPTTAFLDAVLQAIEGVSHFLYLAERARTELPTTQLELELQAEVDKFVVLALDGDALDAAHARSLHNALYTRTHYLHDEATEAGTRYRLANNLAARLSARLVERNDFDVARHLLRRFYRSGQSEKIRLAANG